MQEVSAEVVSREEEEESVPLYDESGGPLMIPVYERTVSVCREHEQSEGRSGAHPVEEVRLVRLSDDVGDRVVVELGGFLGDTTGGGHC